MYTVQHHELSVFAHRAGSLDIPLSKIRFPIKRSSLDTDTVPQRFHLLHCRSKIKDPPGLPAGSNLLTSADLTVTESWQPEPGPKAKPGDAWVRTITWTASDVPGMAFPPFSPEAIDGVSIYPGNPTVEDQNERGTTRRTRIDRVTYVCKTSGTATIPAHTLQWLNPTTGKVQHVDFPPRTIEVIGPPTIAVPSPQGKCMAQTLARLDRSPFDTGRWRPAGLDDEATPAGMGTAAAPSPPAAIESRR
ncbi:MAG: hypothetical protein QM755_21380 [Luteolibacter sp.]